MKREHLIGLLLAAIAFAVFSPALAAGFVEWDDDINIYRNPHLRGLGADNLAWMFKDLAQAMRYKPLSWLTWACLASMAGMEPAGFHLANLLFHSANTALLFLLLLRLLALASPRQDSDPRAPAMIVGAAVAALLWGIHPMRAEPVVWATGLPYDQALFFVLISTLCYLRAWPASTPGKLHPGWLVASLVAFTLALLTYPIVLTYLLALVVLDWWRWQRFQPLVWNIRDPAGRAIWLAKIPFAIVTALFLGLALVARWTAQGLWTKPLGVDVFGLGARVAQAFFVWAYYLRKWLLPFDLSPVYTDLVWFQPLDLPFILSAVFAIGLTALLLWRWRRWPGALALWLAYLALLLPVLGVTEYPHMASDRYAIFAHMILSLAAGAGLAWLWEKLPYRWRTSAGAAALLLFWGMLACRQALVWKNTESLFTHVLARLPENRYRCDIYWRYGMWLMRQDRLEEAEQCHLAALAIAPEYANPYGSLGELRARRGQWTEAIGFYQKSLALDPAHGSALASLAWLRATAPDAAVRNGEEALRIARLLVQGTPQPDPIQSRTEAAALAETGQFPQAIVAAENARRQAVAVGERELTAELERMLAEFRLGRPYRQGLR